MSDRTLATAELQVTYSRPDVAAAKFRRADANADGQDDISDAVAVLNFLFVGSNKIPCEQAGDANDDGKIDIADAHTCVTTDTLQMLVLKKPGYYLPSAFTPNSDGLNDVVRPYLVGMQSLKSFAIFNRWGKQVYATRTEGEGWDGKFQGIDQPAAVYVWMLEFYDADGRLVTEKGTITLIR